jgi:tetratricopeptide (TPR) repeat protein
MRQGTGTTRAIQALLIAAAAMFLFKFYAHARAQSEAARAFDLYEQGRLVDAREVLGDALAFSPRAQWRGLRLAGVAARLDSAIATVEHRVIEPLASDASDAERLSRARDLAMLERTDEALAVLAGSATLAASAEAENLRGTVYETQRAFAKARESYRMASARWQEREDSPDKAAGLSVALKGVAFCERKLGRLVEAEDGYQELLQRAPNADTHFLVAQFYEDTQQARRAQFHAREAMRLDPERYGERGRMLVDKLMTSHFGCWSISSEP